MKANATLGLSGPISWSKKSVKKQGFSRALVHRLLGQLTAGAISLVENKNTTLFGDRTCGKPCHVYVNNEDAYQKILMGGAIGGAEAYMDGDWDTDNLTQLIRILLKNRGLLNSMQDNLAVTKNLAYKLFHFFNRDSVSGSKKNIAAHYDLGDDFFKTFLDETMTYSAALFDNPAQPLAEASVNKIDLLCQKLNLGPEDTLIEIGTGWGALAIHAATKYGCHVTTTTISDKQYDHVARLIKAHNLEDRITLLKRDYRHLQGQYDKLVSVEMIEAVGLEYLPEFFRKCSSLLKPEGQMIIQAITIADQHYDRAKKSVDFIQRYIFPGGALPSVTALTSTATRYTDLRSFDLHDITEHYALTLNHWRQAYLNNIDVVKSMGFDQRFMRMWEYYLAYCEGGFHERAIGCVQIRFHKPEFRTRELSA